MHVLDPVFLTLVMETEGSLLLKNGFQKNQSIVEQFVKKQLSEKKKKKRIIIKKRHSWVQGIRNRLLKY